MNSAMGDRTRPRRRLTMAAITLLTFCFGSSLRAFAETDAKAVMARVYEQDTSRDVTLRATLDITDTHGRTVRRRFTLNRLGSFGNGKVLVRFTDPPELRGVTLLSFNEPGTPAQQWIYTPSTDHVRSVQPRERSERFAGSDFTYEDIAEHLLDDFNYQTLPAGDIIENHQTVKIVATPVAPDRSQYKFIYYWVAQDVRCILHAEMYSEDGKKIREMHASGLRKVSEIWGPRKIEMRSVFDGTKSVLTIDEARLNTGLDYSLFTPEALEKGKPQGKNGDNRP